MSVYKHEYRAYSGKVTPAWTRILSWLAMVSLKPGHRRLQWGFSFCA